jgi:catechol 2,3-dioxygenase-like lactoylglutathione lyase family enzyme
MPDQAEHTAPAELDAPDTPDAPSDQHPGVRPNETVVPTLHCASADETLEFFQALGFEVTYRQTRPYLYLAFRWSGFDLHYGRAPEGLDPSREHTGGCLVMVDEVAPYHAALVAAMRRHYGRVLARGLPRITRYRSGATRFSLMDPSGNQIIFIQRDEPEELEYGGSKELDGLARALDQARIFREFKHDDRAALRHVGSALRRHGNRAPAVDVALALATMIELSTALDEIGDLPAWMDRLRGLDLTDAERRRVEAELETAAHVRGWFQKLR